MKAKSIQLGWGDEITMHHDSDLIYMLVGNPHRNNQAVSLDKEQALWLSKQLKKIAEAM